ncbi:hypothetical protein TUM19329_32660 [Legionella antarctica]|uniref:Uncharacterized protein n=1 Tax=Legionella antarctica TaxID=2708020 RepID=A0A6F8T899_9GAMM|nr:hypothetical protein [Legionella antarctica]BCA96905.1 hypothetical protein TUM19329_32660 [Legionella antarctica]
MTQLKRFHEAQQNKTSGYAQAKKEIAAGKKNQPLDLVHFSTTANTRLQH